MFFREYDKYEYDNPDVNPRQRLENARWLAMSGYWIDAEQILHDIAILVCKDD